MFGAKKYHRSKVTTAMMMLLRANHAMLGHSTCQINQRSPGNPLRFHETLSNCSIMAKMNTHQKLISYSSSFSRYGLIKFAKTSHFLSSAPTLRRENASFCLFSTLRAHNFKTVPAIGLQICVPTYSWP